MSILGGLRTNSNTQPRSIIQSISLKKWQMWILKWVTAAVAALTVYKSRIVVAKATKIPNNKSIKSTENRLGRVSGSSAMNKTSKLHIVIRGIEESGWVPICLLVWVWKTIDLLITPNKNQEALIVARRCSGCKEVRSSVTDKDIFNGVQFLWGLRTTGQTSTRIRPFGSRLQPC